MCRILGKDADAYIDCAFEKYAGKTIYVVKVRPYYTEPLKVNGVIYERHGSSKLPFYNPDDIRRFIERRSEERIRQKARHAELAKSTVNLEDTTPAPSKSKRADVAPTSTSHTDDVRNQPVSGKLERVLPTSPEKIMTRVDRPECPACYDENHDPSTVRYIEFGANEFRIVPEFYGYTEGNDDLLLALPLKEDDRRKWLILGYEDGTVCRIPMKLLFDKQDYSSGKRYVGSRLVFADILAEDEAVISLSRNPNGNWNARADMAEEIAESPGLRSAGERLFNVAKEEYLFNIIPHISQLNYKDLFNRTSKDAGKNFVPIQADKLYAQLKKD